MFWPSSQEEIIGFSWTHKRRERLQICGYTPADLAAFACRPILQITIMGKQH